MSIISKIKEIFSTEEKPEVAEQKKVEEIQQEIKPADEDKIKIVGSTDDEVMEEMLNRVWKTGKSHIANKNSDGSVTFVELD